MTDGNGYECGRKSVSDSLFDDSVPDVEEGCSSSLRREHCFCLNDFFTICGELWAEGRYCAHLRVLADRLYYVDKSEYADLLDFLYRRISDGAYADEMLYEDMEAWLRRREREQ